MCDLPFQIKPQKRKLSRDRDTRQVLNRKTGEQSKDEYAPGDRGFKCNVSGFVHSFLFSFILLRTKKTKINQKVFLLLIFFILASSPEGYIWGFRQSNKQKNKQKGATTVLRF